MGLLDTLAAPVASSVLQSIKKITVETAYLPRIELNDPFAPGPPNPLLQALKPKVTIETASMEPIIMQPYGAPGPTKFPLISVVTLAGLAALIYVGWRMVNRRKRA